MGSVWPSTALPLLLLLLLALLHICSNSRHLTRRRQHASNLVFSGGGQSAQTYKRCTAARLYDREIPVQVGRGKGKDKVLQATQARKSSEYARPAQWPGRQNMKANSLSSE
ncbi:hypothetical protein J3F83DRAFT_730442 [Trichoderma novae-zelandiae]